LRVLGVDSSNPADFYRAMRDLAAMQSDIAGRDARAAQQISAVIDRLRGMVTRLGTVGAARSMEVGEK